MNFIKNEFTSRLTTQNADACLALAQDCRSVEIFHIKNVFKLNYFLLV